MHLDFVTFKKSPLLINHWFADDRMVFKLELMLYMSAVSPDVKIVVLSANKSVHEGEFVAAGIYIENRRGPRTEFRGTPEPIGRYDETVPLTATA